MRFILPLFIILSTFLKSQNQMALIEYSYKWMPVETSSKMFLLSTNQHNYSIIVDKVDSGFNYEDLLLAPSKLNNYHIFMYDKGFDTYYQKIPVFFGIDKSFNTELTKDRPNAILWKITKDVKEILGYKSYKAEGEFRGRKWIVWFTPEIVGDAFPWKLKGLPGAILEAEDTTGFFVYRAERIVLNNKNPILPKIVSFFNKGIGNAVDYRSVVAVDNEFLQNLENQSKSADSKGLFRTSNENLRSNELEKSFDWEIPKTQK